MAKPRSFQYQRRDEKQVLDRIRRYQFDDEFKNALHDAVKGMPRALCNILRSANAQISAEQLAALAELIEWRLQVRGGKGRPRGSLLPTRQQEIEQHIVSLVRVELAQLRVQIRPKRLSSGIVDQVIKRIADWVAETVYEGEPELKKVSLRNIRNAVTRGQPKSRSS